MEEEKKKKEEELQDEELQTNFNEDTIEEMIEEGVEIDNVQD